MILFTIISGLVIAHGQVSMHAMTSGEVSRVILQGPWWYDAKDSDQATRDKLVTNLSTIQATDAFTIYRGMAIALEEASMSKTSWKVQANEAVLELILFKAPDTWDHGYLKSTPSGFSLKPYPRNGSGRPFMPLTDFEVLQGKFGFRTGKIIRSQSK